MSIYEKVSLQIMDKKTINKEQFKRLVIEEAKKFISEEDLSPTENRKKETNRRITFDKVEGLISEMEGMNKSISFLFEEGDNFVGGPKASDEYLTWAPNKDRDLNVNEHNKNKNFKHINESEKDRIKRMLSYNVPKDEER